MHLPPSLSLLLSLRAFRAPHNKLNQNDLPKGLFTLKDLTTIDLENNKLTGLPDNISDADRLLVLQLAKNELKGTLDEPLARDLFVSCTELYVCPCWPARNIYLPPLPATVPAIVFLG